MREPTASADQGKSENETAMSETIRDIFACYRTIAVYGISRDPEAASHRVSSYLAAKGYNIIPINPHVDQIIGRKAYHRIEDVRENIDVLEVFRPADQVPAVVQEAVERRRQKGDIHVIWLQLDIKSEAARELAGKAGILFVQDRCMMVEHRRIYSCKERA